MTDKIYGGICPNCNEGVLFYYWGMNLGEEIYTCRDCAGEFTLKELRGFEGAMWRTDLMTPPHESMKNGESKLESINL